MGYGRHAKIPYTGGQVPVGYKLKHRGKMVPTKRGVKRSIRNGYAPLGTGQPLTSYFGWNNYGAPHRGRRSIGYGNGIGYNSYGLGFFGRMRALFLGY